MEIKKNCVYFSNNVSWYKFVKLRSWESLAITHAKQLCVFPPVCCQNFFTSVIVAQMSCDWPPRCRSSHKGLDIRGWAYATPDDPHHVFLFLQVCGTALDEGSAAFRPQVCDDCLQRDYGCLQHLAVKRGACLWYASLPLK